MVIPQLVTMMTAVVRHRDALLMEIDRFDGTDEEPRALHELSQRIDDVHDVEIAGRDLVQHRCEEKEVVSTDERHLERPCGVAEPLELSRGSEAAEASAKNHDARRSARHAMTAI